MEDLNQAPVGCMVVVLCEGWHCLTYEGLGVVLIPKDAARDGAYVAAAYDGRFCLTYILVRVGVLLNERTEPEGVSGSGGTKPTLSDQIRESTHPEIAGRRG